MQGENTKKLISGGNGVCLTAVSSYGGVPKEQNGCCVCVWGGSAVFFMRNKFHTSKKSSYSYN